MIHRAGFGSFERFIGMLTEQYAGKFPTWLAPMPGEGAAGFRETPRVCEPRGRPSGEVPQASALLLDERDEKIGYKIREARGVDRVPYMLILGEKEEEADNISVRDRSNETVQRQLDDFIADITEEIRTRR